MATGDGRLVQRSINSFIPKIYMAPHKTYLEALPVQPR